MNCTDYGKCLPYLPHVQVNKNKVKMFAKVEAVGVTTLIKGFV